MAAFTPGSGDSGRSFDTDEIIIDLDNGNGDGMKGYDGVSGPSSSASDFSRGSAFIIPFGNSYVSDLYGKASHLYNTNENFRNVVNQAGSRAKNFVSTKLGFGKTGGAGRKGTALGATKGSSGNGGKGNGGGGNGRGGNRASSGSTPEYPSYAHALVATTSIVEWDSPIHSGTVVDDYYNGDFTWSPLFIAAGEFFPPVNPLAASDDSDLSLFERVMRQDVFYDWQLAATNMINKWLADRFTLENFCQYVYTVCRALQVYYCIDSILAWEQDPQNSNRGMESLRQRVSVSMRDARAQLKKKIEREMMPPNVVALIRFMYQNFSASDIPNSSVLKLSYGELLFTDLATGKDYLRDTDLIKTIIDELNDMRFRETSNYVRRAFPSWEINVLLPSSSSILHSNQFLNFWHNMCTVYQQPSTSTGIANHVEYSAMKNNIDSEYYGVYSPDVDGTIYAMSSVVQKLLSYDTDPTDPEPVFENGMWVPTDVFTVMDQQQKTNTKYYSAATKDLRSFINHPIRGASGMYRAPQLIVSTNNAETHYEFTTQSSNAVKRLQYHSTENMRDAANSAIRWLFAPGSIPTRVAPATNQIR